MKIHKYKPGDLLRYKDDIIGITGEDLVFIISKDSWIGDTYIVPNYYCWMVEKNKFDWYQRKYIETYYKKSFYRK